MMARHSKNNMLPTTTNIHKKATALTLIVLQLLITWTPTILSLPQGAPETVCDTMLPFHGGGIPPQDSVPPFRIETSAPVVGQGQTLRVDIVGVPPGLSFGGFMLQARNANPPYQIIGQFNPPPDGLARLMNCENSVNNSATHVNPAPKQQMTLEWQSPVDFLGQVLFNSTIAQSYDSFWVGVQSFPVQVVRREAVPSTGFDTTRTPFAVPTRTTYQPQPVATQAPPRLNDPLYEGCGRSKICFGFPDGCVQRKSCKMLSDVMVRGDVYEFDLKSFDNTAAYIALGLSEDDKMGDDLVIECVPQNGRVNMYSSYTSRTPKYDNSRIGVPQNTARLLQSSVIDGAIYCKVQRDIITRVKGRVFDLNNNKYHLLLASGTAVKENGAGYHNLGRIPSASAISLTQVEDLTGSSGLLIRLHGAFMIIAWIGTTSLGILFARYFKQTWVGSQTCGKDKWFAWHRICMVTTWSLTIAAFVIIFVELGEWSKARNPHAILGLITTILCFIQPIGALFRPAPNSKNRPIFNWAHWLGGNLAHILAIVTIFFSVELPKAQLNDWTDIILIAFVVFHVVVHLIFSIVGCVSDRQAAQRVNAFQLSDMSHHGMRNGMKMERKMDAPYAAFRKILLTIYIVILLLFVIVLVLFVVLAPIEELIKNINDKWNE